MIKFLKQGNNTTKNYNRFISNPLSFLGMLIILISIVVSVLGYLITPDSTPYSNQQFLELSTSEPGTRVMMLKVRINEHIEKAGVFRKMLFGAPSLYRYIPIDNYSFEGSYVVIYEYGSGGDVSFKDQFHLADVVYPLPYGTRIKKDGVFFSFNDIDGIQHDVSIAELQQVISSKHIKEKTFLLGTDRFGRDLLSRLIIGTRISLSVGLISVIISLLIGVTLGAIAGYYRGTVDSIILWFINVVWSVPTLLMVIAITLVLGKGFWQVFVAVGLTMWVEVARVVRGQVMSVREKEYVEAAKALGFNNTRIIVYHILPNIMNPVIIISAANFASAILIESGLSFLGIGVQPPIPSWGNMIKDHYGYIIVDMAYLAILPGVAIMLMVLAFTLVGNGLRDAFDVRNTE